MRILNIGFRPAGVLFSGAMLYFFANVQRVAVPGTVFDQLQAELDLPAPYITGFGSAFMYVYALAQLPVGMLADRFGGTRVIAAGALLFCSGSLLFGLARAPAALYAARMLTGLGAAAFYLSLIRETIRAFDRNCGIAISVVIMIGYAGGVAATAPFAAGIETVGFRNMLLAAALLPILFYLLFLGFAAPFPRETGRSDSGGAAGFGKVLASRRNRELFLFSGINFGLYYVIQTVIGRKFLQDFCNLDSFSSAWALSLTGVLSASAGVLFAVLSRLAGNRRRIFCRLAGIVGITVFPALALLVLFDIRTPGIAGLFCLLALTASLSSITIPLLLETNEARFGGAAIAWMNFSFYLAVAVFGNLAGSLMDLFAPELRGGVRIYGRDSYLAVFAGLSVFAAVSARCSWKIRETMGRSSVIAPGGHCPAQSTGTE